VLNLQKVNFWTREGSSKFAPLAAWAVTGTGPLGVAKGPFQKIISRPAAGADFFTQPVWAAASTALASSASACSADGLP
jgi:hypothetical protein